jgi:uncharacterized linocin/CFP29 family protein
MSLLLQASENMDSLRRVGMDTAQLTDEELRYIDARVVDAVKPQLVARRLFPVFRLPHAGFTSVRGYKQTDLKQARLSMYGQGKSKDRISLTAFDVNVPVLHSEFKLYWRDLIASRNGGLPLETRTVESAARQVAEEEDKLLLTGEMTGWKALGIEGLATATGRNTTAGGDWSANALTYVSNAIAELETDGHQGPYALITRTAWLGELRTLISSTSTFLLEKVAELCKAGVYASDSLYESDGTTHNALVVEPGQQNFELVVGQDLSTFLQQDDEMNLDGKVYEVVAPRINRPTSICEITALT